MDEEKKHSNFHLDSCCEMHFFVFSPLNSHIIYQQFSNYWEMKISGGKKNEKVQLSKASTNVDEQKTNFI